MTDEEKFQKTFDKLHASPDVLTEVLKKTAKEQVVPMKKKRFTPKAAAAIAAVVLAAGSGSAAYAMDVGGIQRIVQVWIHGDQTDAIFNVENGNYTLDYKDADGNDVSQGGGGVAYENGTERPLTADELLDEINMPEVEYEEDGTVWVYRITFFRKIFILLSLFLIPESFAISMYPNSAIFAAVFFVCALNRLLDGKFYVAMVLMVIAPLYRIDILIVYPVVFFIFLFQRKSVKESITRSAFLAVLILLFVTIGYWGLRANPLTALTGYNGMNETHSFASQVKFAVFTFYTILNFVFVPMGLVVLFREKKFGIMGIALFQISWF